MLLHHPLPSGARVRLRLPVRADTESLRGLVGRETAERLLRFDPRRRAVICAVDFEEVRGVGAIDLRPGALPDVLEASDKDVAMLLALALQTRADTAKHPPARRGLRLRRTRRR